MYQPRSMSRMCRVLLSGAAAITVCAHAAVPGASPFGASASGSFEPTKPLAGGGWQLLSDSRGASQPKTGESPPLVAKAGETATPVAQSIPAEVVTPVVAGGGPMPVGAGPRDWTVSTSDGNYRLLIERWAREAGWKVAPWEVDQDVEIGGTDAFNADFKTAVRRVLSATEMTDYSLKPCFYSNNYVRVVKLTTKCDPSK